MSSEISTESYDPVRLKPDAESQPFQPWQLFTLAGLIGATIVVFLAKGQGPAGVILLSLIIFAAGVLGVAVWRTCAPLASREEPGATQMLGGRTRAALWREKTLVLRSIKELEFDHAMGKVSEKDFSEMSTRLRLRATRLMRQLDAGTGYRELIEKEIARRVGEGAPAAPAVATAPTRGEGAPARPKRSEGALSPRPGAGGPAAVLVKCSRCGTENDTDAQFCKRCGGRMETGE